MKEEDIPQGDSWQERSRKSIIGEKQHNFELAIIAGSLQRVANSFEESVANNLELVKALDQLRDLQSQNILLLNDVKDLLKKNEDLKEENERLIIKLNKRWWEIWK